MLLGTLDQPGTYQLLLNHGAWMKALNWLQERRDKLPNDGEYELEGHDLRAIVQTVNLQPRSERLFEAHRREIDLQCCFTGSETIEWISVEALTARTEYDDKKDFTLYDVLPVATAIHMTPGTFAIFFPGDGHMPGSKAEHDQTRKVVIKINTDLL